MYPGYMHWWKSARRHGCEAEASCEPGGGSYFAAGGDDFGEGGGHFGVRRPLRFLAYKLGLDEKQVGELATILNELKTERAQAAVDNRRAVSGFADALAGDAFDAAKADAAAQLRLDSAKRLRDAVVRALGRIHAVLDAKQRARLAELVTRGVRPWRGGRGFGPYR